MAERVATVLAKVPKLSNAELIALLERPPFTGGTSKKLWQAVIAKLEKSKDPAARTAMLDLSTRYQLINGTNVGEWVAGALARAAAKMPADAKKAPAKKTSLDDLFAQIVAAPDDDGPRIVYADMLIEKGKPRGEFIVLQVDRAAGRGTAKSADKEREEFILETAIEKFAVPLSAAADAVTFHRGFPFAVQLKQKGLAQVVDAKEWGTVRKLTGIQYAQVRPIVKLLSGDALPNLVHVGRLEAELFAKLPAHVGAKWTTLELNQDGFKAKDLARFKALRTLELAGYDAIDLAALPALESLAIENGASIDLPRTLKSLTLGQYMAADGLYDVALERLSIRIESIGEALAYLDVQPSVRTLAVHNDDFMRAEWDWAALKKVLAGARALAKLEVRGHIDADFERGAKGWSVTFPVSERWIGFYDETLPSIAGPLKKIVTSVVLYPEEPRHCQKPFSDTKPAVLAAVDKAFAPLAVEKRDAFAWPGVAVGEGWMLNRDRCCPSR